MKQSLVVASLLVSLGAASGAYAQAKPEVLVKQRQAAMTLIGKYFGPLGGMAQGKVPYNAQVVQRNAGYLDNLSRMPWDGFDKNTENEKSRALPAIWKEDAKWKEASSRFENETAKLYQVSRSGDEAAVKAQIGAVGKTCAGCHDNFRQKQ
jgi:cytochrome c556